MSKNRFAYRRQLVAISCAVLCGCSGMGLATARTIVGNTDGLVVEDIDTSHRGALTILLMPLNPYDDIPEGQLPPGGLADTVFTVHKIKGIDLSSPKGWRDAESLSLDDAKAAEYDYVASAKTDEWGRAVFEDLPVGIYFVTASTPDDGVHNYRQPQDMVITIPVGEAEKWNYQAVVVAKNEPKVTTTKPVPTLPEFPPVTTTPRVPGTTVPATPIEPVNETPGNTSTTSPSSVAVSPGAPGGGNGPGNPGFPAPRTGIDRLPMTGASVVWSFVIAAILVISGLILLGASNRRRKNSTVDK